MKKIIISFFTIAVLCSTIPIGVESVVSSSEPSHSYTVALDHPINLNEINLFTYNEDMIITQIFEGLFQYNLSDPSLPIIPCLAMEHGQWSTDHLNFTITLNPNITFHNGFPFTAEIVQWNFNRRMNLDSNDLFWEYSSLMNPDSMFYPQFSSVFNSSSVLDPTTIRFSLNYPCLYLEDLLSHYSFSIIYPNDTLFDVRMNVSEWIPFGTGPYTIKDIGNTSCTLQRYQDYWAMIPKYESLHFVYFTEIDEMVTQLSDGEIDFLPYFSLGDQDVNPTLQADHPNIIESTSPNAASCYIVMNWDKINISVQEAIRFALNYSALFDAFDSNYISPSQNIYPPVILGNGNYEQRYFEFNISRARQILLDYVLEDHLDPSLDQPWIDLAASSPIANLTYWYWDWATMETQTTNDTISLLQESLRLIGVNLQSRQRGYSFAEYLEYYESSAVIIGSMRSDIVDPGSAFSGVIKSLNTAPINFNDTALLGEFFQANSEFDPELRYQKLMVFQTNFLENAPFYIPIGNYHINYCYNSATEVVLMNFLQRFKFGIFSGEVIPLDSSDNAISGYSFSVLFGVIFIGILLLRHTRYSRR
ncbi:MAG: ABC transporter substrate-binding protein [Promethearchaeota archaeon]